MLALATYKSVLFTMEDEVGGYPIAAVFSEDSRYLYEIVHCSLCDSRYALMRYDLQTLESEMLAAYPSEPVPALYLLADGSFLSFMRPVEGEEHASLLQISPDGDGWQQQRLAFELPLTHFNPAQAGTTIHPPQLLYSRQSGYALAFSQGSGEQGGPGLLVRFRPDDGMAGMQEYWAIPSPDAEKAVAMTAEEALAAEAPSADVAIYNLCLSADGERALLLCYDEERQAHLRILDLADMSLSVISGLQGGDLMSRYSITAEQPIFGWYGDRVIMGRYATSTRAMLLEE